MSENTSTRGRLAVAGVMLAAITALSGCGHSKHESAAGLFDNQNQATLSCMAHQSQKPGPLYTPGAATADTAHILQLMQYYTSNGSKPFCDKAKPTTDDTAWAKLYVSLGGPATKVNTVLGTP